MISFLLSLKQKAKLDAKVYSIRIGTVLEISYLFCLKVSFKEQEKEQFNEKFSTS